MNINNYNTIFVVYPIGLGGNHLANILSLSPYISNRTNDADTNYRKILLKYYNYFKFPHVWSEIQNVGIFEMDKVEQIIKSKKIPVVLPGHFDEAYFVNERIKHFAKSLFIVVNVNETNEYIEKRSSIRGYPITYLEKFVYDEKIINRNFNTENVITIEASELFSLNALPLFNKLNDLLNLDLDIDFCNHLHQLWINKL